MTGKPEPMLYLSDARGIYIPRDFARDTKRDCISGVDAADLELLARGPDEEWYWDAWASVLDNARVTDPVSGVVYRVDQDGDCWLVPEGMEWNDGGGYFWPEESDEAIEA